MNMPFVHLRSWALPAPKLGQQLQYSTSKRLRAPRNPRMTDHEEITLMPFHLLEFHHPKR